RPRLREDRKRWYARYPPMHRRPMRRRRGGSSLRSTRSVFHLYTKRPAPRVNGRGPSSGGSSPWSSCATRVERFRRQDERQRRSSERSGSRCCTARSRSCVAPSHEVGSGKRYKSRRRGEYLDLVWIDLFLRFRLLAGI